MTSVGRNAFEINPNFFSIRTYSSSHSDEEETVAGTTSGTPGTSTGFDQQPTGSTQPVTLCDVISRKTLFYLISTLNMAFPDYDFSDTRGSNFSKEPSLQVHFSLICCHNCKDLWKDNWLQKMLKDSNVFWNGLRACLIRI